LDAGRPENKRADPGGVQIYRRQGRQTDKSPLCQEVRRSNRLTSGAERRMETVATLPLKERYKQEISPSLMKKFDYTSPMQVPKIEKVVINMGVGEAVQNAKV